MADLAASVLARLKNKAIERIGSAKGGHWVVKQSLKQVLRNIEFVFLSQDADRF